MGRLNFAGAAVLVLLAVTPARAQSDAAGSGKMDLPGLIRLTTREAGGDADRESLSYLVAVNMSANQQNGFVGQQIRRELRGLMNRFLVDGESFTLLPFQLKVEEGKSETFAARNRLTAYDWLDRLASRPGSPQGGSDVEVAKFVLMREMKSRPSPVVGLVFTNYDASQQPRAPADRWTDHPENIGRLQAAADALGVQWKKFALASEQHGNRIFTTYVHVGVRRGAAHPLSGGTRGELIERQNAAFPAIPAPEMTAVKLLMPIKKVSANGVHLRWEKPAYGHDGFDVLVREAETRKPVRIIQTRSLEERVTVPATKRRYAVSVAAVRGPERERGRESQEVIFRGDVPPPPVGQILFGFLVLIGAVLGGQALRSVRVVLDGQVRVLTPSEPEFSIVGAGYSARGPRDIEVASTSVIPLDRPLASIRRSPLGGVTMRCGDTFLLQGSGSRTKLLPLASGVQMVQVVSGQDPTPVAALKIQVGNRKAPAPSGRGGSGRKKRSSPPRHKRQR